MGVKITDGFDPGEDEKVVSILKKFKGGPISDALLYEIAGMMPTCGLVVVLVYNPQDPEVLFVARPSDDNKNEWKNKLNLPGKLFRNADFKRPDNTPRNGPLERIQKAEIETDFPKAPEYVGVCINSDSRGSWAVLVYKIVLEDKSLYNGVGEWVKVSSLLAREDVIKSEINHINVALGKVNYTD